MEKLSADCAKFPKRCFIVFSRNPMTGTDVQKYKVQFRQSFNSYFSLVKSKTEVAL